MFRKAEVHLALPFAAIINLFFNNTSAFPATTRQNVCCEKNPITISLDAGLLSLHSEQSKF